MRFFNVENSLDHYSFGMLMPERNGGGDYRYGVNGKESDSEISENIYNYGFRIYNSELGRFLSTDPIIIQKQMYPWYSPYHFAGNNPILNIDIDGLEEANAIKLYLLKQIESEITLVDDNITKKLSSLERIDLVLTELEEIRSFTIKISGTFYSTSQSGTGAKTLGEFINAVLNVPSIKDVDHDIKMYTEYKEALTEQYEALKKKKIDLYKEKAILEASEATDGSESKKGELLYTGNKVEILEGEQGAINRLGKRVEEADNGNTELIVTKTVSSRKKK